MRIMKYYAVLCGIYEIMRKSVILCGNDQIVRFYAEMVKLCGIALTALNQCPCGGTSTFVYRVVIYLGSLFLDHLKAELILNKLCE